MRTEVKECQADKLERTLHAVEAPDGPVPYSQDTAVTDIQPGKHKRMAAALRAMADQAERNEIDYVVCIIEHRDGSESYLQYGRWYAFGYSLIGKLEAYKCYLMNRARATQWAVDED